MFRTACKAPTAQLLFTRNVMVKRTLYCSSVRMNLLADLYLKELKTAGESVKKQDLSKLSEDSVRQWQNPAAPKIPDVEASNKDLLEKYVQEDVDVVKEVVQEGESANQQDEDWLVLQD